jgi:hypothetical protein
MAMRVPSAVLLKESNVILNPVTLSFGMWS